MGTRTDVRQGHRKRGLASFISFLLLFAFALGQGSSLFALADGAGANGNSKKAVSSEETPPAAEAPAEEAPAEEAPAEEAPAEEAPAEQAPAEEAPVADEGSDDTEDSAEGAAATSRTAPKASQLKVASAGRGAGILSHGGLHGGDVNLDFVAAGPFTYDHSTGLGTHPQFGYDNRTISKTNGVVESLEGGDFECDDLVTFFVQVEVEEGAGTGDVALDLSFGNETTGQPGLGFDNIVSYGINTPDDGNVDLDGDETVSLSNEHIDTSGYDELKGTFTVTGLEGGETAIVRVTVHLECEIGASPTGNILNAIDAARVVGGETISVGQETVPMKQVGGLAAEPAIEVFKDCPTAAAAGEEITYEITVTNTGNVDLTNITVVDDIIGNLSGEFPDSLAVGSDPVTVEVGYTPVPADGDPVVNTVTATGDWEAGQESDSVSATSECTTDITHAPGILVEKECPTLVASGADVTFTITITNTGDEPLTDVMVNDDLLGGDITDAFDLPDPLPVGTTGYSAEFTYTPGADEDPVVNSVEVSAIGTDSEDQATSSDVCQTDVSNPAIQIIKTVSEEIVPVGTTVTYSFEVTNIGDVTLYDVVVTDDIMGFIGEIAILEVDESVTLTKDFVVGDEPVLNVATAVGEDILGRVVSDTDDAFVTPIAGENPSNPPTPPGTPFTGSDAGRLGIITIVLFGIGAAAVATTRRRRSERDAV
jgi:uncharacterized repeat protein (TIGR01451 family)